MIASKEEFNELLNGLKAKNKENKLGKTLQSKLQAFLEVEELINLPISGVGCSYFTASDIGSEFEIVKNASNHGFEIGETVVLEALTSLDDDEYKFRGKKDYWWCGFADVKKL